jgi:hypothetical protein
MQIMETMLACIGIQSRYGARFSVVGSSWKEP